MQAQIDRFKYFANQTPDPLAGSSAPYQAPPNDYVKFPRADIGILSICYAAYSGSGSPMYVGYCPAVRFRFNSLGGRARSGDRHLSLQLPLVWHVRPAPRRGVHVRAGPA